MCVEDNVKCDVNQYTTTPTPTPCTPSRKSYNKNATKYSHAANSLLKTIDFTIEDIKNWAILDSGATSNFLITDATIEDERPTLNAITAKLPDGRSVTTTRKGRIRWRDLPKKARWAHKLPGLATHSLISVTTLCDAGCTVNFTKIGCHVTYRGKTILCGRKCKKSGLWMIPLADDATNEGKMSTNKNLTRDKTTSLKLRRYAEK